MRVDETCSQDDRFNRWFAEHRGIFVKIARAYATTPSDQDDLQQDMLLAVWASLPSFAGQARPATWIYRVCLNTALNWQRGERNHRSRIAAEPRLPDVASPEPRPGIEHERAELLERLYATIRQLAPGERSLVLLALDALSYAEIASITGLTENHVGVALSRARAKLAEQLKGISHELA